jgi:excisionase family DNA binding protein
MAATVSSTNSVLTSEHEARQAEQVLAELRGDDGSMSVEHDGRHVGQVPREVGLILQQVLEAIARGGTVTVTAIPDELTTTSAAALLGVSRPTLMTMVNDGRLPAHKVGSHTRLRSVDVLAERRARRDRERAAFRELLELEGDDD